MKIVVGISDREHAAELGGFLKGLRFSDLKIELIHVLERIGGGSIPTVEGVQADLIARYMRMQETDAETLLSASCDEFKRLEFDAETQLLTGYSANRIIAYANESDCDLLTVGSTGKGSVESLLLGSVGRKALISATCSVLIIKKPLMIERPLKVVFATDHSEYANSCLERFLAFAPRGIGQIAVTTVYPDQLLRAISSVVSNFKSDVSGWVRNELERNNQRVVEKLRPLGAESYSRVESGNVSEVLTRVMSEENADLLVLGAQGHGFAERIAMGSVSLEQALRRPYSTLVLRQ